MKGEKMRHQKEMAKEKTPRVGSPVYQKQEELEICNQDEKRARVTGYERAVSKVLRFAVAKHSRLGLLSLQTEVGARKIVLHRDNLSGMRKHCILIAHIHLTGLPLGDVGRPSAIEIVFRLEIRMKGVTRVADINFTLIVKRS
jgi:hypothetical protein